jgi:uncharacterized protein
MESKLIHAAQQKTWAIIFKTGDEVMQGLKHFASEQKLSASQFTAIGAFSECVLGFFQFEKGAYNRIQVREQVEVLSLVGDVALAEGEPKIHAHAVLGKADGTAHGGHLLEARVQPTLEVILTESPAHLHRVHDPASGLALINARK